MAQHDYNIGDQNGFDFLVDLNNALSAIATNNAGSSEPNPTFPHMLWFDTNNDLMKVRNEANSAWVIVAKKDGSGWTPYRQGTALGTASVQPDDRYAHRSNNLSDLGSATAARANLEIPAPVFLTQTQVEDANDTAFGQVSGQRLAQAVASVYYDETTYVISTPVATLEILGLGAYNRLEIDAGLDYVSSGSCKIQVSSDNGSTWKTTGYSAAVVDNGGGRDVTNGFPVIKGGVSAWYGNAWISNFNTAAVTTFSGMGTGDSTTRVASGAGSAVEAVAYNAIRIIGEGNITSGRVVLRGYK